VDGYAIHVWFSRQRGSVIKSGVNKKVSGRELWTLVSYGHHQKGAINVNDLPIDSSTVAAKKGRGKNIGYNDGYNKKNQGSKIHAVVVTYASLPVTIDLGPGNEEQHESRRLITLLKDIQIGSIRRPRSRPKCVCTDNNKYHTPLLVMMYLASRRYYCSPYQETSKLEEKTRQT
jgi:hypothetical protein